MPETRPCFQHAKSRKHLKNTHQGCCQVIYAHHFIMHFAGGRTSSVVGSMFWEKFVGLRSSLVEVRAHTGKSHPNMKFYFLEIGMFISQTSSISPLSCLKRAPFYNTQNARKHPKTSTRGVVRRYILTVFCVFHWWSDQLSCRLNVLGKVRRAQMKFGGGWSTLWHSHQNMTFLFP